MTLDGADSGTKSPTPALSGKREREQSVAVGSAHHARRDPFDPTTPADRYCDVLPSVDAVGRWTAVVSASGLELPQQLTGPGVQRIELSRRGSAEHQVTSGGQH